MADLQAKTQGANSAKAVIVNRYNSLLNKMERGNAVAIHNFRYIITQINDGGKNILTRLIQDRTKNFCTTILATWLTYADLDKYRTLKILYSYQIKESKTNLTQLSEQNANLIAWTLNDIITLGTSFNHDTTKYNEDFKQLVSSRNPTALALQKKVNLIELSALKNNITGSEQLAEYKECHNMIDAEKQWAHAKSLGSWKASARLIDSTKNIAEKEKAAKNLVIESLCPESIRRYIPYAKQDEIVYWTELLASWGDVQALHELVTLWEITKQPRLASILHNLASQDVNAALIYALASLQCIRMSPEECFVQKIQAHLDILSYKPYAFHAIKERMNSIYKKIKVEECSILFLKKLLKHAEGAPLTALLVGSLLEQNGTMEQSTVLKFSRQYYVSAGVNDPLLIGLVYQTILRPETRAYVVEKWITTFSRKGLDAIDAARTLEKEMLHEIDGQGFSLLYEAIVSFYIAIAENTPFPDRNEVWASIQDETVRNAVIKKQSNFKATTL